jgi:hypothetical protein
MPNFFLPSAAAGKRAIVWGMLFFLAGQVMLGMYLNRRQPDVRDPEFGLRLLTLRKRLAENPGAPLVLVLGSSRTMNGLSPAFMSVALKESGPAPLIFNFALAGSGSIRELMTYRRLRDAGIKADWLLIESWPVLWPEDGAFAERRIIAQDELNWSDLPVVLRYLPGKAELAGRVLKGNLVPLLCYRSRLLHAAARNLLPRNLERQLRHEQDDWTCRDGTGWLPYRKIPATAEALRREVEKGLLTAAPLLNAQRISPEYDRALRNLLDACRGDGIRAALFVMPEHSACRSWYTPHARVHTSGYLTHLSREYQLPVFDLRDWAADEDYADFCHLAPRGVKPLSARFAREILQPWLNGEYRR